MTSQLPTNENQKVMVKIDGKYEQPFTEKLLERIKAEDSITKRHHLIPIYLHERDIQIQKVLANIENDDIDFAMVIEQLWEDLRLACEQINATMVRSDLYADSFNLTKWDSKTDR